MIAIVSRNELFDAVECARKGISTKSTLPVFMCLRIEATEDNRLDIAGATIDLISRVHLTVIEVQRKGGLLVPCSPFAELLAQLPECVIRLEAKDYQLHVSVVDGAFRSKIAGFDISDFPELLVHDGVEATCDKDTLVKISSTVGHFVSRDTSRLVLTGVCLTRTRTHALAVATDGHRLSRYTALGFRFTDDAPARSEWIVDPKALKTIIGMSSDAITARLSDQWITLASSPTEWMRCEVSSRLIDGPYPDWRQTVRSASAHQLAFARDPLLSCLKRAMAVSRGPSPRIIVRGIPTGVVIASYGPQGLEREGLESLGTIEPTRDVPEWSCNPVHLEEIVSMCPAGDVKVGIEAPLKAIHVAPTKGDGQFFLLMPIRIEEGAAK